MKFLKEKSKRKVSIFLASILIPQLIGGLSGLFTASSIDSWYRALEKPVFNPPNWVFGPVWTALYLMMGVALYLVWTSENRKDLKWEAGAFFFAQLFFNFIWSFLFFSLEDPGLAFLDIIFLWMALFATMIYFWKISRAAFWFLVPYLLWISFAAVLNWYIWRMN